MKYIYAFLLSAFCFMFMPATSFAADVSDFIDYLGITYDELQEFEVQPYFYQGYFPNVYSDFNPSYQKDYLIKISGLSWYSYKPNTYPFNWSGSTDWGQWNLCTNDPDYVEVTMLNSGHPLFDEGGIFTLNIMVYSQVFNYTITYSDGTTYSEELHRDNSLTGRIDYEIDIDNLGNDIVKIVFKWSGAFRQSSGGSVIGFGFVDYGYLVDDEPLPEPEPEVPLVDGDLNGTIEYLLSTLVAVVDCLFLLQIVDGVTFGYFIIACMIFGIVFSFLFRKLVK